MPIQKSNNYCYHFSDARVLGALYSYMV